MTEQSFRLITLGEKVKITGLRFKEAPFFNETGTVKDKYFQDGVIVSVLVRFQNKAEIIFLADEIDFV